MATSLKDQKSLAVLAKTIPGLTSGDGANVDAKGVPKIISDMIAAGSPKTDAGDFDATKPPQPDLSDAGVPEIIARASSPRPPAPTAADVMNAVPKPLTDHIQAQDRVQQAKTDMGSDSNVAPSGSKVPPVIALASKIKTSVSSPADNSAPSDSPTPVPDVLMNAANAAKNRASAPDVPIPAEIRSVIAPDSTPWQSPISDIAQPDANGASVQHPPILKEPFGHKLKRELPTILNLVGAVGAGLEAAGGPVGGEPHGAEMLERTLNAQANRAIASRQADIAQQKADTDEGYRKVAVSQFGTVPVQIPDPQDPTKTITVQVQQKDVGRYANAATTAGGKERSATESNAVKLYLGNLKAEAESGKVAQYKPGTNPDTGQYELQKLDKQGNSLGWVENSVIPSLVERTSKTIEWKQLADGSMVPLPKQTISGPVTGQPNNGPVSKGPGKARVLSGNASSPNSSSSSTLNGNPAAPVPNNNRQTNPNTSPMGANAQNPVIGFDQDGQQVFTSAADAPKYGLTQIRKVGQAEAEKVTNARSIMPVFSNTSPSDPGIVQLINTLDQQGKLGVVASRWNEFLAGKVGAGDPLIEALRTKMGLAETALMQIHVGARGSAALMEHFHNLVNSGGMNAETMKSGILTELNYIRSKAMLPKAPASNSAPGATPNKYGFVPASN
jgi:hypothetical protein